VQQDLPSPSSVKEGDSLIPPFRKGGLGGFWIAPESPAATDIGQQDSQMLRPASFGLTGREKSRPLFSYVASWVPVERFRNAITWSSTTA